MKTLSEITFPYLRAAYIAEMDTQRYQTLFYIRNGYMETWQSEYRTDPDRGINEHATSHTLDQYRRGEIDRQTAEERAEKRYIKAEEKERSAKLETLDLIAGAPEVDYIDIRVDWKRSACWGYNPTATADIHAAHKGGDCPAFSYECHTCTASGCGYDKGPAAVGGALNKSYAFKKILYSATENALASGHTVNDWSDIIGYGSGHDVLPYLEGGVGVSCFWHILDKCGYKTHRNESGRHSDYYYISKKE